MTERIHNACMAQIPIQPLSNPGNPWECWCVCACVCMNLCKCASPLLSTTEKALSCPRAQATTNVPKCPSAYTRICGNLYTCATVTHASNFPSPADTYSRITQALDRLDSFLPEKYQIFKTDLQILCLHIFGGVVPFSTARRCVMHFTGPKILSAAVVPRIL